MIKAQDEGGLSSTTTLNIKISDINDKNPEFIGAPYEFSVNEGLDGAPVGQVEAVDGDEGVNSLVRYSLPDDLPFLIDANTGHIRTAMALDYEKNNVSRKKSHLIYVIKKKKKRNDTLKSHT